MSLFKGVLWVPNFLDVVLTPWLNWLSRPRYCERGFICTFGGVQYGLSTVNKYVRVRRCSPARFFPMSHSRFVSVIDGVVSPTFSIGRTIRQSYLSFRTIASDALLDVTLSERSFV